MTLFSSSEFIDVANELMADGIAAVVRRKSSESFNVVSLEVDAGANVDVACKLYFVSPSESNLTDYEVELDEDNDYEHKWAIIDYREEFKEGDLVVLSDGTEYQVKATTKINPMGAIIVQRVKLFR